jgi:CDP-archaeol synthase
MYLFSPLLGSALFNGLCIRYGWLTSLDQPLDFNLKFRGYRLFGENKTLRGLVAAGIGTAFFMAAQNELLYGQPPLIPLEYSTINPWLFGFAFGSFSMLSELPNSFAKRQLGIPPGKAAKGIWLPVFFFLDQVDLLVGCWLLLATVTDVTICRVAVSIIFIFVAHLLITVMGYFLGMRKTIR